MTLAFVYFSPSHVRHYANDFKAMLLMARYRAIMLNEPIAVVWQPEERRFDVLRAEPNQLDICNSQQALVSLASYDYPRVRVLQSLDRGIVWLPSGQGQSCLRGAYNDTVRFASGRHQIDVKISRAGRVLIP